jgi:hypothetical protein
MFSKNSSQMPSSASTPVWQATICGRNPSELASRESLSTRCVQPLTKTLTRASSSGTSRNVPFATTDYEEQGCEKAAKVTLALMRETVIVGGPECSSAKKVFCTFFDITPNPFHMPGQKQVGSLRMPSLANGFITALLRAEGGSLEE